MAESKRTRRRHFSLEGVTGENSIGSGVARELAQEEHQGEGELQSLRVDQIRLNPNNPRSLPMGLEDVQEVADQARRNLDRDVKEAADAEVLDQADSLIQEMSDVRTRTAFERLLLLARSIHADRLISPITVRFSDDGKYELLAGERRYLAHVLLGRRHIRALHRRVDAENTEDMLRSAVTSLMENLAREDLTLAERVEAIEYIAESKRAASPDWQLSAKSLMSLLHFDRRLAYRYMTVLEAPDSIRQRVATGELDSFNKVEKAIKELESQDRPNNEGTGQTTQRDEGADNSQHPTSTPQDEDRAHAHKDAGGKTNGDQEPSSSKKRGQRASAASSRESTLSLQIEADEIQALGAMIENALSDDARDSLSLNTVDWTDAGEAADAFRRALAHFKEDMG